MTIYHPYMCFFFLMHENHFIILKVSVCQEFGGHSGESPLSLLSDVLGLYWGDLMTGGDLTSGDLSHLETSLLNVCGGCAVNLATTAVAASCGISMWSVPGAGLPLSVVTSG